MSTSTESCPIDDREVDSARQYWMRALSMDSGEAVLPVNNSKSPQRAEVPVPLTISGVTFERLTKLTTGSPFLLYVALLTAIKVCLYKYSRGNVITVGVAPLRKEGESFEPTQALAIVDRIDERMSFRTLLLNIRETIIEAYQYQDYPLRDFVDELGAGEDKRIHPQVMVVVNDICCEITPPRIGVTLKFERRPDEVSGTVDFDSLLYNPEMIGRFIIDFQNILSLALDDTTTSINNLSAPTPAERRRLISEWNNTSHPFPENLCMHELLVSQASNTPDRVAVIYDGHHLSYLELNRRANRLAGYLKVAGARPEECIALCLERGLEIVIGILGVLKAGGVYAPLDPGQPSERLAYMINDAQATILLTEQRLAGRLPSTNARVVCLDVEWDKINEQSEDEPESEVVAENLAYVIYTSGSTGEPKGAAVQHKSLVARIAGLLEAYELTSADRLLQFVAPSFDAFGEEVFTILSCGASLVIDPRAVNYSAHELFDLVEKWAITTLHIPPVYWHQLVDELFSIRRQVSRQLRLFITGGESPSVEKLKKWAILTDNQSRFVNAYGPTEATITSTVYDTEMESSRTYPQPRLPIGRPIANTEIYILDLDLEVAPIGMKGELYIGGAGVARGYLGRAGMSAEKFVPHPFSGDGGARLYRTGDVGRYLADGNIEFIGRVDEQVKIRGYRIELGEIEAVLSAHPSVKQSVVVASDDESGNKRLVGYVVGEEAATAPSLKKYVRDRLPDYMLPDAIILLEEMPITANGKVNRKKLLSMPLSSLLSEAGGQSAQEYVGARTPAEEILVGIFEEVLKLDRIGIRDNFFEIGGHSLLATQVVSRIRNVFGVEMSARSVFEGATVESLARSIEEAMRVGNGEQSPPLVRVSRDQRLPLSFAQQRLWFLDQLISNSTAYNCPGSVRLEGRLDLEALERSVNEIIRRHEVLRTRFEVEEGMPLQVIDEWEPRRLEFEDLTSLNPEEREERGRQIAREEAGAEFDLGRGPLLRVKILKLGEEEHVALFTTHHIVSDAWSMKVLFSEVGALYRCYHAGEPSPLPELEIQYADFAVWERKWLQGEALATQLGYWREQLAGLQPLELPTDYARPALASYHGASLSFGVSEELTDELRALSRREGVTLFMTLLAGFQTLLARYSGQQDVALGTPVANRTLAETEALIGIFVNTIVLRTQVLGSLSFQEILGSVRTTCLSAYAYQDLPFEQLVERLQPERDLSRHPLFQVMLTLQHAPVETPSIDGLRWSNMEIHAETSTYDLMFSAVETADQLGCNINFNSDLFDATTVGRISEHFKSLLKSVVANPTTRLSEIDYLPPEERRQIIYAWNQTAATSNENRCIHQLFESQVARTPEAMAVCFRDQHLSYQELNARANQLAYRLRMAGIGPEKVVGVCCERSVEMLVGVLGALKAGGAYLPLDPAYPPERLSFFLKDSGVTSLVTQKKYELMFSQFDGAVMYPDEAWRKTEEEGGVNSEVVTDWESTAYVIYTSGSTGAPKGVAMVHRALTNLIRWQLNCPPFLSSLRTLQFSSLSFDVSFQEIFSTLCAGGSLVLIDEETHRDPNRLWRLLREEAIERLFLPFVALQQLAEAADLNGMPDNSLRRIITAGEALKLSPPIEKMLGRLTKCVLENQYGPTESHVVTSYSLPQSTAQWGKKLPPIGRPIANTEIYILDGCMQPVPTGVIGDLYIGGSSLARSYINHPIQTGERFIPDPFSERPGGRLYLTGDRSRYLSDGNIEFLGRRDEQVKVRGYRVELGEIEAVLGEAPHVRECAVTVRMDDLDNTSLVGYLVCQEGVEAPVSELRRYLQQRLPDYMIPSAFVYLKNLPMTPSGKVDRKALPAPERKAVSEGIFVAPETAIEEIVVGIFKEVLNLDRVGMRDDFFDIGGHSLLATQVASRVRKTFGVEIGVRGIFEEPTVEGLAGKIESAMRSVERDEVPPLVRAEREGQTGVRLPLSFAQQRLWFLDQLAPNNSSYNMPGAVKLEGRLNLEVLERVVNEVVRRHEVLRTRIEIEDGRPMQVIDEWSQRRLEVEDLTGLTVDEGEKETRRIANEEAVTGFDLSRGPIVRVKALRLGEEDHVLVFTMHHIVSDAWSMGILVREIAALYQAYSAGESSPLDELPLQYADFAVWQREWLKGEALENQLAYWKHQLGGDLPTLQLPTDQPRSDLPTRRGAERSLLLPAMLSDSLKTLSVRQNCTLFMTLLAAFKTLLYYLTGQTDIIVGTDIANRNRAETEKLIGFFVNQLVLRTKLSHGYTFEALLKNIREITLGAYAHQDLPFEKLVEALNPNRAENRSPLFQVKMALQNAPVEELSLPGLTLSPISVTNETSKFDLLLNLTDTAQGLSASLQFDADLFDESTPERILNRFHTLLDRVVERPDATLQDLVTALVEEDKREQMGRRGELETVRLRRLQNTKRRPIADTNMGVER